MTALSEKLAQLTPERRALLERRLAARRPEAGIPPRAPDGPAPLSFAQARLWFVQQLAPSETAYNLALALRLRGPLDEAAMQTAFAALVERHEALRMRCAQGPDGAPVQTADARPPLQRLDLSAAPDPEAAARDALDEIAGRPHDLAAGAVRAGLARLGAEDHLLAIGLHHIAADRWSLGILVRELAALYAAACREEDAGLPQAPRMLDYAAWQHAAQGAEIEAQLTWWRERLADAPALELPRDRRPGAEPQAGFAPFALPDPLASRAREAARRRGVSLYTLLLGAFALTLSRVADTDDVVLGTDVSGRGPMGTGALVGPLVNTLALRVDLSGAATLAEAQARAEQALQETMARQDAPLDQVVEALNPDRAPGEPIPLFRAKFDLQQAETLPEALDGLRLERMPLRERAVKYELRFNLEDDGAHIGGRIEYRADLYDAATVETLGARYARVLAALLDAPETAPADLPLLDAAERAELLALAEGPPLPPHAPTLHEAVSAQAARTPGAVALTHADGALTYAQIEARAEAVAAALIARDLPSETRIGVHLRRGPDLVPAILGVLKAGCAYVPLDPAWPPARLALLAQDASLALTLVDGPSPVALGETLDLADIPPASAPVTPRGHEASLAVVIYTSGSTGRPKGVALEHRAILSRVAWAGETFDAEDFSGVLFATSVSFDLSLFEIFATLAHGGRLVLAQTLLDLPALPASAGVTLVNTVPSLLRELTERHDLPGTLRVINLAGEFFPPALLDRLQARGGLRRIHNLYGPTEDAIYDAGGPVQDEAERPMPIGRPLPGTRLHILDRDGRLLPRGAAGEICVAGAGLARGYLDRPELTAERFVPDPFDPAPGARLYRTGDRGRWRADGRIDILGRIDAQVKLRGLRIEIGEIEAALEACAGVAETAVLATGAPGDADRRLIAHVAPDSLDPAALREALFQNLPRHMIPALWSLHPALPRMPNGKVDRRALAALPLPDAAPPAPPATETEAQVIALWQALLEVETVGAEDDFFARGGHSLLAMRLLARLRETFEVELPLGALFEALTPRRQAALVDAALSRPEAAEIDLDGLSDAEVEAMLARMDDDDTEARA